MFDLCIYDGPLPVCLLLPCLLDSTGDQQQDEGRRTHTTHIWNIATVCMCMHVCVTLICFNANEPVSALYLNYTMSTNNSNISYSSLLLILYLCFPLWVSCAHTVGKANKSVTTRKKVRDRQLHQN